MLYAFDHPSDWTVEGPAPGAEMGSVTITGPGGEVLAWLDILIAWGAECPCVTYPAVYLGSWTGGESLSVSGPVAARSMAVDLSAYPSERVQNNWPDNVRVVTSLGSAAVPPPLTMMPRLMYALGLVETEVVADNGSTGRTVLFWSSRDFATLDEARSYTRTEEHQQIQEMIASFRER